MINPKIQTLMTFFLDKYVEFMGFVVNHFSGKTEEKFERQPKVNLWLNHTFLAELIRDLINQFIPLTILLLQYRIPKEKLDQNFGSCKYLIELLNKKLKTENDKQFLEIIDFLMIIYPYACGSSSQILMRLINRDYYYQLHNKEEPSIKNNHVLSSTDYWKFEILNRCVKEYHEIMETHNVFKDLNLYLRFYHLNMMTLNIMNSWNMKYLSNMEYLRNMDIELMKELHNICLNAMKECMENNCFPLLNLMGVFFILFKIVYRRRVRLCISLRKKDIYQKKDMQYLK